MKRILPQLPALVFSATTVLLVAFPLIAEKALAEVSSCICDCVYARSEKIKNHKYFESNEQECSVIEGRACIGTHRGETFRGTVSNCESGAKEFSNLAAIYSSNTGSFDSVVAKASARGSTTRR